MRTRAILPRPVVATSETLMDSTQLDKTLNSSAGAVRGVVERLSAEVWQLAEVSLHEQGSSRAHVRELEASGFGMSMGSAGVPTAFVAEWKGRKGESTIGFLPDYDPLPGL